MLLHDLVITSSEVAATRSRLAKVAAMAMLFRRADVADVAILVPYLSGELRQRRTGIGWASFRDGPDPAELPAITIQEVDDAFATIATAAGAGSTTQRRSILLQLLARCTAEEQEFIRNLNSGNLRQGALEGIVTDAVARAFEIPTPAVRRASMLSGNLAAVAIAAKRDGEAGLGQFALQVGIAIKPMLAQSAPSLAAALEKARPAAIEWKLDGVRAQVHKRGDVVEVFTRTLDKITERVPEVVETVGRLQAKSIILDGEVIALYEDGRPRPFQVTGSRVASKATQEALRRSIPLTVFFFDVLHLDGQDLIDRSTSDRIAMLDAVLPPACRVPRIIATDETQAKEFVESALNHGHEGVMVKDLEAQYEAGRRGAGWIKVKPHHTLDLVILAVERGHGRRQGWLSNLHLGALDATTGDFVMLGKTFKGLTDEMLRWQTQRLQELAEREDSWTVYVRKELVVEIAFDGIQSSTRYPSGMALRFARVVRYREDKRPEEADTVDTVRSIYESHL